MSLDFEKEIAEVEKRIAELTAADTGRSEKRKTEITGLKRKVKTLTKKVYSHAVGHRPDCSPCGPPSVAGLHQGNVQ